MGDGAVKAQRTAATPGTPRTPTTGSRPPGIISGGRGYDRCMTDPRPAAHVHQARLALAPGADPAAPGAAVTVALCGTWDHPGRCRWPHHTSAEPGEGGDVVVRGVFACGPGEEPHLRARIVAALATGRLAGPTGESRWTLAADEAGHLSATERGLGDRLLAS
jgi:hypothetical protein